MAKIKVAFMKDLYGQFSRGEISFSRMCELINEEIASDLQESGESDVYKFSKRLDQIFEQGNPTKAQIIDAFNKFSGRSSPKQNNEVTMHDLRVDDDAREERKMYDCICKVCKGEFKSSVVDAIICPSCYV